MLPTRLPYEVPKHKSSYKITVRFSRGKSAPRYKQTIHQNNTISEALINLKHLTPKRQEVCRLFIKFVIMNACHSFVPPTLREGSYQAVEVKLIIFFEILLCFLSFYVLIAD